MHSLCSCVFVEQGPIRWVSPAHVKAQAMAFLGARRPLIILLNHVEQVHPHEQELEGTRVEREACGEGRYECLAQHQNKLIGDRLLAKEKVGKQDDACQ